MKCEVFIHSHSYIFLCKHDIIEIGLEQKGNVLCVIQPTMHSTLQDAQNKSTAIATRDSKSSYVGSPIPLVSAINSSTYSGPPSFCCYCIFIVLWNQTENWAPQIKTSLKWGVVPPFLCRPQVGSSKGLKPVVMWWSDRVLPWSPAFYEHISKQNSCLYFVITGPPI